MGNYTQWTITDSWEWQTMGNGRWWETVNNMELEIMVNNKQWSMTDNEWWQPIGNEKNGEIREWWIVNDRQWVMAENGKWLSDHIPFLGSETRVSIQHSIYCATTKINHLPSLFDIYVTWYIWLCIMIYKLQLILYSSKFNLKTFRVCTKKICSVSQCKI